MAIRLDSLSSPSNTLLKFGFLLTPLNTLRTRYKGLVPLGFPLKTLHTIATVLFPSGGFPSKQPSSISSAWFPLKNRFASWQEFYDWFPCLFGAFAFLPDSCAQTRLGPRARPPACRRRRGRGAGSARAAAAGGSGAGGGRMQLDRRRVAVLRIWTPVFLLVSLFKPSKKGVGSPKKDRPVELTDS